MRIPHKYEVKEFFSDVWEYTKDYAAIGLSILISLIIPFIISSIFAIGIGYAFYRGTAPISNIELRIIIFFSLLLVVMCCFGILRLYNALVGNSKFLLQNKTEFKTLGTHMKGLDNALKDAKVAMNNLGASNKKNSDVNKDALNNLNDTIKTWKKS